jgi:hypothetical protein
VTTSIDATNHKQQLSSGFPAFTIATETDVGQIAAIFPKHCIPRGVTSRHQSSSSNSHYFSQSLLCCWYGVGFEEKKKKALQRKETTI